MQEQKVSDIPFAQDKPPVVVKAKMAQVKWPMAERYRLICDKKPTSARAISKDEEIELIPYRWNSQVGCCSADCGTDCV